MRAPNFDKLQRMSPAELQRLYDGNAEHTQITLSFILDEIRRREASGQARQMLHLTWAIAGFTLIMVAATIVMLLRLP